MDRETRDILKKQDLRDLRYWKIMIYGLPIVVTFLFFGGGSYKFGIHFLWNSYMGFFNIPAWFFFTIIMLIWMVIARFIFKTVEIRVGELYDSDIVQGKTSQEKS